MTTCSAPGRHPPGNGDPSAPRPPPTVSENLSQHKPKETPIVLDAAPTILTFREWKTRLYTIIHRAADRRNDSAIQWVRAVEAKGAVITDFQCADPEWASMENKLCANPERGTAHEGT